MKHAIERTSPKGEAFVGRCWQCGREGLNTGHMAEECENIARLTEEESLIIGLEPLTPEEQAKMRGYMAQRWDMPIDLVEGES